MLMVIILVSISAAKAGSVQTAPPSQCTHCRVNAISRQTSAMKLKFYRLLERVIKTLTSNTVDPGDILAVLPQEISSQLRSGGATTINDIFKENAALDRELRWYSFSVLVQLVSRYGDARCRQELAEYIREFGVYIQSRSTSNIKSTTTTATETQIGNATATDSNQHPTTPAPIKILVDPEWDQRLVGPESDVGEREYIASLFNTTRHHIQFIPIQAS